MCDAHVSEKDRLHVNGPLYLKVWWNSMQLQIFLGEGGGGRSYLSDAIYIASTFPNRTTSKQSRVNMAATDLVELFTSIGLSEQKAKETLKNEQLKTFLKAVITEVSTEAETQVVRHTTQTDRTGDRPSGFPESLADDEIM